MAIFEPDLLDETACYRLLIGCVLPRAIGWTSTLSGKGVNNLAPFSFFTVVSRKPPMVSLTMQPRSDRLRLKDTLVNIRETGEFVVNVATLPQVDAMHASSTEYEPDVDEFEAVGLGTVESDLVRPHRVRGAPIAMECRLERILQLGDVDDHLVIGRVVRFHVDDRVALPSGRIDTAGLQPVGRMAAEYTLVESMFACPVPEGFLAKRDGYRAHRVDGRDGAWSPLDEKSWSPAGDAR